MDMLIQIFQALSDSRFWLMPLLFICIVVILAAGIITTVQEEIDDKL